MVDGLVGEFGGGDGDGLAVGAGDDDAGGGGAGVDAQMRPVRSQAGEEREVPVSSVSSGSSSPNEAAWMAVRSALITMPRLAARLTATSCASACSPSGPGTGVISPSDTDTTPVSPMA